MEGLAVIIANMLKSVASWEQEHGTAEHDNRGNEPKKWLTALNVTDTLNVIEPLVKGGHDDHEDKIHKSEQSKDIRRLKRSES